jgi:nucleoid DNA-binding protein
LALHSTLFSGNEPGQAPIGLCFVPAGPVPPERPGAENPVAHLTPCGKVSTTMARKVASNSDDSKRAPAKGGNKPANKGEIYSALAEKTGLSKKQIAGLFDALGDLIGKELGKKGPGQFVVPGLLKLKVVRKPATKAKPGINPFTKEPMTIKAKPARNVVRAIPMKALKELV